MLGRLKAMKKIAIDVRMISSSGIGVYIKSILSRLISKSEFKYYLLGNREELLIYSNFNNVEIIEFDSKIYSINEQFQFIKKIPKDIDLFWSPHYNIPVFYKKKLLVTIHDIFHIDFPYKKGILERLYPIIMFKIILRKANKIISVSNFTKTRLVKRLSFNSDKIKVIYNGVDITKPIENFKINKPYILYVGNVKPHKNLNCLVQAFKKIKGEIPHNLVIVGKKSGFINNDNNISSYMNQLRDRIIFTGLVSDERLSNLYKNAECLVCPSLYEGFGLTPLEAMANGCPTIVSDIEVFREIYGNSAIFFNPNDSTILSEKLKELINDESLKINLVNRGLERSKFFSWDKTARETIDLIRSII